MDMQMMKTIGIFLNLQRQGSGKRWTKKEKTGAGIGWRLKTRPVTEFAGLVLPQRSLIASLFSWLRDTYQPEWILTMFATTKHV
jgi:hypothetical protein